MTETRSVRIVSSGNSYDTHVFDATTGAEIDGVISVEWAIDAEHRWPRAVITLMGVEIDVTCPAEIRHEIVASFDGTGAAILDTPTPDHDSG